MRLVFRFVKAVWRRYTRGNEVSKRMYKKRLEICKGSENTPKCAFEHNDRCTMCGCYLLLKAKWSTEDCPLKKWPPLK